MKLILEPVLVDSPALLVMSRDGDSLTINGEVINVTSLQEIWVASNANDDLPMEWPQGVSGIDTAGRIMVTIQINAKYWDDIRTYFERVINDPPDGPIPLPQGAEEDQT